MSASTSTEEVFTMFDEITEDNWGKYARCVALGLDPELFFPAGDTGRAVEAQVREAKAVCFGCPAASFCLAQALLIGATGVWGGTTEDERRAMRRRRFAARVGA